MGRREALLEQEPHRVALVAEDRLDAHEDIAELLAEDIDAAPVRLDAAGGGAPAFSMSASQGVPETIFSAETWAAILAGWPYWLAVPPSTASRSACTLSGTSSW